MNAVNLTNHFLIAMPALADPNFSGSLTYICRHDENGAMGVVINRPMNMTLENLFHQINLSATASNTLTQPVYFGGPVQTDRGFVLHSPVGHWRSTLQVNELIGLTTSRDILEALAQGPEGEAPEDILISLGYAGWEPGQLEQELKQNSWLTVEADMDVVFKLPVDARFSAALGILGIDPTYLSDEAGHA